MSVSRVFFCPQWEQLVLFWSLINPPVHTTCGKKLKIKVCAQIVGSKWSSMEDTHTPPLKSLGYVKNKQTTALARSTTKDKYGQRERDPGHLSSSPCRPHLKRWRDLPAHIPAVRRTASHASSSHRARGELRERWMERMLLRKTIYHKIWDLSQWPDIWVVIWLIIFYSSSILINLGVTGIKGICASWQFVARI